MSYVVAFNGARDFYQVPLALYENHLLERLVTDVYYSDNPLARRMPWMMRFRHRHVDGLPSRFTKNDWYATALQLLGPNGLGPRLTLTPYKIFSIVDDHLSRMALKLAQRADTDLFLYSGYAREAFAKSAGRRKGLFVFHPHHQLVRALLDADFATYGECAWSMRHEQEAGQSPETLAKFDTEIELADFIVCASSFTRRSLLAIGCAEDKISVVPYGTDVTRPYRDKGNGACRFLFVGQGLQRKGLHHLLRAWRDLKLREATLTIVAYSIDPELARDLPEGVVLLPGQSKAALIDQYAQSHVFVMPSIVEGFGHVYLEALAMGCFVIGTENSGLPDLEAPSWAASCTPAGDLDALRGAMETAYKKHRDHALPHAEIRRYAEKRLSWQAFREKIGAIAARMSSRRAA